jgi:trans-aconitate methyltransferase
MTNQSSPRTKSVKSSKPTVSTKWNAAEYAAHSAVQQSWARELIARLNLRGNEHVLDVGCGDGKVTAEIANAVPRGLAIGIDASAEMIGFARKTFPAKKFPNLEFQVMDARKIKFDRRFDLIFSNATLHWVDDHQSILHGMASVLKSGGRLIVSCGGKGNAQDVFVALRPELRRKSWSKYFRKMPKPYFFYSPADYEKWLPKFGFKIQSLQLVPKDATYAGADGFAAWLRTTWLPYVQRVPTNRREEFIADVVNRYLARHPADADGKVYARMVRLEIDAVKV